jgi:hypothetical protein
MINKLNQWIDNLLDKIVWYADLRRHDRALDKRTKEIEKRFREILDNQENES